jgi:hypothetical protein
MIGDMSENHEENSSGNKEGNISGFQTPRSGSPAPAGVKFSSVITKRTYNTTSGNVISGTTVEHSPITNRNTLPPGYQIPLRPKYSHPLLTDTRIDPELRERLRPVIETITGPEQITAINATIEQYFYEKGLKLFGNKGGNRKTQRRRSKRKSSRKTKRHHARRT